MTDVSGPSRLDPEERQALESAGLSATAVFRSGQCPDPALVLAADAGVLDESIARRVQDHVSSCAACRRVAGDLSRVLDDPAPSLHRVETRLAAVRSVPVRRSRRWLLAAAGLAAATVVWGTLAILRPVPEMPERDLARVGPSALPTVFQADRPLVTPGDIELPTRGEATPATAATRIAEALDRADADEVAVAVSRLSDIVRAEPSSRDAQLALGATLLRAGRPADALQALGAARALADPPPDDEVNWFLAIALVQTGDVSRARELLGAACAGGGPRSAQACSGLEELSARR